MRFLIDRCAGRRLARYLREQGHDVLELGVLEHDPGDAAILRRAADDQRILVTIDTDFGALINVRGQSHAGLIRLPDVPVTRRIELMRQVLSDHAEQELVSSVVTVKGARIRISRRGQGSDRAGR